jgi:hypothetical protein
MVTHRHMGGEEFELRLVACADDHAPPLIRLRHVLKQLLRTYHFRCTEVRDVTPYPSATPTPAQDATSAAEATDLPF